MSFFTKKRRSNSSAKLKRSKMRKLTEANEAPIDTPTRDDVVVVAEENLVRPLLNKIAPEEESNPVNAACNVSSSVDKLTCMSPSPAVYREPVLTRVAASLRNSPSESSDSMPALHILDQCTIINGRNSNYNDDNNNNNMKTKHPDTLTLPSSLTSSPLVVVTGHENNNDECVMEGLKGNNYLTKSTVTIITEEEDNGNNTNASHHINSHEDSKFNSGFCQNQLMRHELNSLLHLTTNIPSTSNAIDNLRLAFDDIKSSIYNALGKFEEKLDVSSNSTIQPCLHPITSEIAVQTDNDNNNNNNNNNNNVDLDASQSPLSNSSSSSPSLQIFKETECKAIQTDGDHHEYSLSVYSYREPTFQEQSLEEELLRMEKENQRLNVLVEYTRAEMTMEMNRRIAELRQVWECELLAILETAGKIWEQDMIQTVDEAKKRQWCAYCGNLAYYYCCWNTSYCNNTCQTKHWTAHSQSCVQAIAQLCNYSTAIAGGGTTNTSTTTTTTTISTTTTNPTTNVHINPTTPSGSNGLTLYPKTSSSILNHPIPVDPTLHPSKATITTHILPPHYVHHHHHNHHHQHPLQQQQQQQQQQQLQQQQQSHHRIILPHPSYNNNNNNNNVSVNGSSQTPTPVVIVGRPSALSSTTRHAARIRTD
ncbi:unnamed protein product [Trichobilharzia szidati]|nr:unnamed protein product [Trichobilharzia szidati]